MTETSPPADVARLFAEADRLAAEAESEEARSRTLAAAVVERLAALVPHAWLWQTNPEGPPQFRWSALDDPDLTRELLWERECSDLHVRALFMLATVPPIGGTRSEAWRLLQHLRRHFWPDDFRIHQGLRELVREDVRSIVGGSAFTSVFSDAAHRTLLADDATWEQLRQGAWLRLLRSRPESRGLLWRSRGVLRSRLYHALLTSPDVRSLPTTDVRWHLVRLADDNVGALLGAHDPERLRLHDEFDATMRWHIERWLEDRAYPFWALTWVADPSFARGRRAILEHATELAGRVPAYYFRVAQQMRIVPDSSAIAARAYLKAIESDDAATLHTVGRRLKELDQPEGSLRAFRRALECDPRHLARREWEHRSAAASVLWAQGDVDEAIAELGRIRETGDVSWRTSVIRAMAPLIRERHEAERLRDWLESVRPAPAERSALADFHEAVLGLVESREEPRKDGSPRMLPVVTPVALAVHPGLLPEGDEWPKDHPFFKDYAPKMRAGIETTMGVRVPGIRVRSAPDSTPAGRYTISIDEVVEVAGNAMSGARFCLSAEALARVSRGKPPLGQANDPLTGRPGHWVAAMDARGEPADGDVIDHYQFMLRHVEAVLRGRLGDFMGIQELENTLEVWEAGDGSTTPSRQQIREAALPDTTARLELLAVLRRLLRDRVPIHDLATILDVFAARGPGAPDDGRLIDVAEAIRLRLRESLPGNREGTRFFDLAPEIEALIDSRITSSQGRVYLTMPPPDTQAVLAALRRVFAGVQATDQVGVVTRRDRIRPFFQRVVALEHPHLPVLAFRELLPRLRRRMSGTIALTRVSA